MKNLKIFQLNTELYKVTGIQRVILDIHEALKDDFDVKIVGNIPFDRINESLRISENDYIRLRNPFIFRNSIVIIHERRLLPFMWLLSHIPGLNIKYIYVHHNELYGNKKLSLFPKNIVAISDAGIRNLTDYFGVPRTNITKIHNCVRETSPCVTRTKRFDSNNITILYPARINSVKRQIEIVNYLKGRLDHRVRILFAGTGPQYEELKSQCEGLSQFQALGFKDDIPLLMSNSDFVMLFSSQEGLPISLIEGAIFSLPLICNNVGGNYEIAQEGKNLVKITNWDELILTLNKLPLMSEREYNSLSQNSRDIYIGNFTFDIFKTKYTRMIELINEKS